MNAPIGTYRDRRVVTDEDSLQVLRCVESIGGNKLYLRILTLCRDTFDEGILRVLFHLSEAEIEQPGIAIIEIDSVGVIMTGIERDGNKASPCSNRRENFVLACANHHLTIPVRAIVGSRQ